MEKKVVLPGDKLSTSEELHVGDGTYEENGDIKSSRIGIYEIDEKNRVAKVKPLTSIPVMVKNGDNILAEATSVRSMMVIANVFHVVGKKRSISGDRNGTLHVSEVTNGYVKDPSEGYGVGDIFRAKVIQINPSLQLSTKGREYGVIKSLCSKCRNPLSLKNNDLECNQCGYREKRKLASDYGNYDILKL
jgi:exosome complex component CSL4